MYLKKPVLIVGFTLVLLIAHGPSSVAQRGIEYQNRGNRYEGIKPRPVSGYDIELISALVDYREETERIPQRFKIKFYLDQPSEVHITVRELDYKYYYWMDKVKPPENWRCGFDNVFEWPTEDVVQRLEEMKMYDLGIVARLGKQVPSKVEQVAPIIFYHSHYPPIIEGYLFTFKTGSNARLACYVYKEETEDLVYTQHFRRVQGGRVFTLRWHSPDAAEGFYKIVIRGYLWYTNDPIDQTVRFYHRSSVE